MYSARAASSRPRRMHVVIDEREPCPDARGVPDEANALGVDRREQTNPHRARLPDVVPERARHEHLVQRRRVETDVPAQQRGGGDDGALGELHLADVARRDRHRTRAALVDLGDNECERLLPVDLREPGRERRAARGSPPLVAGSRTR